jgi:hypothetical protein
VGSEQRTDNLIMDLPTSTGLAGFLAQLDERLALLGPQGVVTALHAAAARLSPSERPAFLAMFDKAAVVSPPDDLLDDIEAFIAEFPSSLEEANEQRWRQRRGRSAWWGEDDDAPVSGEVDDLYRRVGERFLAGDWAGAAAGYRRLLNASVNDVDSDDGCVVGGSTEIVQEALARMIRAILADPAMSHAQRAASIVEVIDVYGSTHGTPALAAVLQAHPAAVDDLDGVLGALGGACEEAARTASSWIVSNFHSIALDIAVAIGGPNGVARLARDVSMPLRDRAWERWMTELASADRLTDALAVGAQALQATGPSRERARLADQYGGYQRSAGDHDGALATGVVAFGASPSLRRLRQVFDDAGAAGQPAPLGALSQTAGADPLVRLAVRLLAGQVDDQSDATASVRLGTTLEASSVAIAALLRTSTASQGRHTKLCDALIGALDGTRADRHHYELMRQAGSDPEPLPLAPRLIAALVVVAPQVERLTLAVGLVEAAAADVMSNKWRGSYPLVARLVVALAHTSEAAGGGSAVGVIGEYDRTYRRFAAFRKELQQAAKSA